MVAAIAEAAMGPKPGMHISRRTASSFWAILAIVRSSRAIASSRVRNCTASGANASHTSKWDCLVAGLDQPGQFAGVSRPLRRDDADFGQVAAQPIERCVRLWAAYREINGLESSRMALDQLQNPLFLADLMMPCRLLRRIW